MQSTLHITRDMVQVQGPRMLSQARRMVRAREDAEDLVQDMWLGALGSAQSYAGRASVRTWLGAILRRRAADHYRRQRPTLPLNEERCPSQTEQSEQCIARGEQVEHLLQHMPELSELEQAAVSLCTLADLDRDEACAQLGVTRPHLRVLLHRARRKLEHSAARD